jgi:hypothetical protein
MQYPEAGNGGAALNQTSQTSRIDSIIQQARDTLARAQQLNERLYDKTNTLLGERPEKEEGVSPEVPSNGSIDQLQNVLATLYATVERGHTVANRLGEL